ncbi:hypothetical protein EVAR_52920_1 [Eumeta japonica]|uniref:Uncharacterized protein n=1 Tax=Eumeta variegata TaxID=151549 RepID=A0A4C1Y630_EUMVA|nr:hypothetical protein EVAR_52920_1 [Eumeta japonica]
MQYLKVQITPPLRYAFPQSFDLILRDPEPLAGPVRVGSVNGRRQQCDDDGRDRRLKVLFTDLQLTNLSEKCDRIHRTLRHTEHYKPSFIKRKNSPGAAPSGRLSTVAAYRSARSNTFPSFASRFNKHYYSMWAGTCPPTLAAR